MLTGNKRLTYLGQQGRLPGGSDCWDSASRTFTQQMPSNKPRARPGAGFQGLEANRSQTLPLRDPPSRKTRREI